MAEFPSLPLFTDSWLADTAHLTRAERDIYMHLLILCWRSPECRVPNEMDWLCRRLRCAEDEVEMLEKVISEFMTSTGNWLYQKRLTKEFNYLRKNSKKQSDLAKRRWNKEKDTSHSTATRHDGGTSQGDATRHASGNAPHPTPPNPTYSSNTSPVKSVPTAPREDGTGPKANGKAHNGPPQGFEELDRQLRAIPGLDRHPVATDPVIAAVWKLVESGINPTVEIIPRIARIVASSARPIKSWGYFAKIIADDIAASPQPQTVTIAMVEDDALWAKRLGVCRQHRWWDFGKWGPAPNQDGTRVPAKLIKPGDGDGWVDFKDYHPPGT